MTQRRQGTGPDLVDEPARMPATVASSSSGGARRQVAQLLLIGDQFAVLAAVFAASFTREALNAFNGGSFAVELLPTVAMVPLVLIGLAAAGCYRPAGAGLGGDTVHRFLRGTGVGLVIIGATSFALNLDLSRLFVLLTGGYLLALGLPLRWELRRIANAHSTELTTRVVVAGTDATSLHLARTLDGGVNASFDVIGHLSIGHPHTIDAGDLGTDTDPATVLGDVADLAAVIHETRPDAVIASAASMTDDELRSLYVQLEPTETELIVYPSLVEVAARRLDIETTGPFPLLHLSTVRMTLGHRALKRALDLTVALLALVLALPLLLAAVIAIRLDSRGPAIFRQERVGLDGKPFTLLKLRTMVHDAEDQLDDLMERNEAGEGLFKMRSDPRVTRVGGFLRRTSIDELPQLVNVLAGHMSLVGPRPALPSEVEQQAADQALRRHRIKPGITGYWQVSGRSEVTADEALRMDLYYVENWSIAFDLLILARTAKAVLAAEGAY